jgi:hypothetical protein
LNFEGYFALDRRCKMHTGPKRATYVSRADVQELDLDQIVGKILMRMTPRQFEIRCTHNLSAFYPLR